MATKIEADFDYTDADLLALVREAIATITKFNQSYTIRGREFVRADLDDLFKWETELATRVSRKSSGLAQNLMRFRRPR